ncbi:MAG: hypothetical protein MZW92_36900 [Comamonadaceae bacterium]|nr:hypothetical protein [Comamonadaceae bacterium]
MSSPDDASAKAMLARLQQLIAASWLIATLIGVVVAQQRDQIAVALAILAFALGAHAAILAVEFVLMAWVNRTRGEPVTGPGDRLRAWWGESAVRAEGLLLATTLLQPPVGRSAPRQPDPACC